MYKIRRVEINGFWHRLNVACSFNDEVNIIIGKNGTGKTTFMNILHAVLTIDTSAILENDFDDVKIILEKDGKKRTIKAVKQDEKNGYPFSVIEYQISRHKRKVRLMSVDERRMPMSVRRRLQEEASEIRAELDALISLASLSVYRLRNDDDYEVRDRHGSRMVSPVDYRLEQALQGLMQYQLELSQKVGEVAAELQSDVLASILYSEEDAQEAGYKLNFDKEQEQISLISAYEQLNSLTSDIRKKIKFHVNAIDSVVTTIMEPPSDERGEVDRSGVDIKPLEALRKTRRIIALSLKAKEQAQIIFAQRDLFLKIIKEFIPDKIFSIESGMLRVSTAHGHVAYSRLSSGEKQLIILLVEALLQNRRAYVFLADEPELSLHIAWQKMVVPAIRKINPNAQVIAATHSPEVASRYPDSIFDMEEMVYG